MTNTKTKYQKGDIVVDVHGDRFKLKRYEGIMKYWETLGMTGRHKGCVVSVSEYNFKRVVKKAKSN